MLVTVLTVPWVTWVGWYLKDEHLQPRPLQPTDDDETSPPPFAKWDYEATACSV